MSKAAFTTFALLPYEDDKRIMSRNVKAHKKLFFAFFRLRGHLLFCILSVSCLLMLLRHSDTAVLHMNRGLRLCAGTVIPSLFPFMVLCELIVSSGCGLLLGKLCEPPMRTLFGISGAGASALIIGLICGFPTGTKTAVSLCRHGQISSAELSRLICFCNIPGAAFLMNVVGVSLFDNRRFGIMLYGICLFVALWSAWLLQRILPIATSTYPLISANEKIQVRMFTNAVTSAAGAMLYVCAYVVFFTAVIGTLGELIKPLSPTQGVIATLFGIFELSGGVMEASAIENSLASGCLCAFLCGWSGLSVHLQIISLCDELPAADAPHICPYLLCKLFQGIFCALLCGIVLYFFPSFRPLSSRLSSETALSACEYPQISPFIYVALIVFALFLLLWRKQKNDRFRTM